jgi:hypothetical protein
VQEVVGILDTPQRELPALEKIYEEFKSFHDAAAEELDAIADKEPINPYSKPQLRADILYGRVIAFGTAMQTIERAIKEENDRTRPGDRKIV